MAEITDRYNSLRAWQKTAIILFALIAAVFAARVVINLLIALLLVAVPFTFFLIVSSEDLQNRIKSSAYFSQWPGFDQDKNGLHMASYAAIYLLAVTLVVFLLKAALFSSSQTSQSEQAITSSNATSGKQSESTQQVETTSTQSLTKKTSSRFQIVYAEQGMRNDDGYYYYVLTDPVNIFGDDLQSRIETIVRKIIKSSGSKITIDIFDNREALDIQYQVWVTKDLSETLDEKREALVERHLIASFEGGTTIGPSANTIILFPNATNKVTDVSGLARSYEFTP